MPRWCALLMLACQPPVTSPAPAPVGTSESVEVVEGEGCRHDIPDCSAACALRATHHLDFVDWYDRRCAAVIHGLNPDRAAGRLPPELDLDATIELAPNPYLE